MSSVYASVMHLSGTNTVHAAAKIGKMSLKRILLCIQVLLLRHILLIRQKRKKEKTYLHTHKNNYLHTKKERTETVYIQEHAGVELALFLILHLSTRQQST